MGLEGAGGDAAGALFTWATAGTLAATESGAGTLLGVLKGAGCWASEAGGLTATTATLGVGCGAARTVKEFDAAEDRVADVAVVGAAVVA